MLLNRSYTQEFVPNLLDVATEYGFYDDIEKVRTELIGLIEQEPHRQLFEEYIYSRIPNFRERRMKGAGYGMHAMDDEHAMDSESKSEPEPTDPTDSALHLRF